MHTPDEIKKGLKQCAETETCENCYRKTIGRYQKCASCRRYSKLKDRYVFYAEDDTDDA